MDDPRFYLDRDLVFPIHCVEVRDPVFVVEHADHDAEETGNLGHDYLDGLTFTFTAALPELRSRGGRDVGCNEWLPCSARR